MMKMNKNVESTLIQIKNTLDNLIVQGVVLYTIPCDYRRDKKKNIEQITWKNHMSGREVSSKAFTSVNQYLRILSTNAYHALLIDYSIVRCSFIFQRNKILSQHLLWWPCPVRIDRELEEEFGLVRSIQLLLDTNASQYLRMRTPIRLDFDVSNNTPTHPRAHLHMQHYDNRINTMGPICFNRFMRFILENYYPNLIIDYKQWNNLNFQYDDKHKNVEYVNKTQIII